MTARSLATDLRAVGRRAMAAVRAAPAWLGGILTGLQGLALSYLAVLAPSLAVAASAPVEGVGEADWSGATAVATSLWLLGHGVAASVGGVSIGLVPLGLTALAGAILAAVARRFAARTWASWALAVATYAAGAGAITSMAGDAVRTADVVTATLVAVLVAAVGVAAGIWRAHGADLAWLMRVPAWVRAGVRRAAATMFIVAALSAVAGGAWAVAGRHAISDAATALDLDAVSAGALSIAELAYVPTLVVWLVAWMTGQGFAVGQGTEYAPHVLAVDALPTVPLLGALPSAAGGLLVWAPLLVVAVALAVRIAMRRPGLSWRHDLAADAVAVGTGVVAGAIGFAAASGPIGPGRLETVGPHVVAVTAVLAGLMAAGLLTGALAIRVWQMWGSRHDDAAVPSPRESATVG